MSEPEIPKAPAFDPRHGELVDLSPLVRRLVAPNAGPLTFHGTNTYVVGRGAVAVIDPGPDLPAHVDTLLGALGGERVTHIVVTHTHRDHSPAARRLKALTGAPIVGCAPHMPFRAPRGAEIAAVVASNDLDYAPDQALDDGERLEGDGFTLSAVATPGHTMNHLAFALTEEGVLFSGDHVMAWSTTIVAPPSGSMAAYMASLEKLRQRGETLYWPGHGGPVTEPQRFLRALQHHRRQREIAILKCLRLGETTIERIVEATYETLDPRLKRAAGLSVLAHLEDLQARGKAAANGPDAAAWHLV